MKPTELMIGDWVAYRHKYMSEALLCEVISIDAPHGEFILRHLQSNNIDEFGNKDYSVIKTRYEDVFPIPLTPEILKKNGCTMIDKGDYGEWHIKENPNIPLWQHTEFVIFGGIEIHFVHQLQHAFHLCRLEELANNFII